MSTRGACGFRYNETDYVMYNHFDSYPEGLGVKVVETVAAWTDDEMKVACLRIKLVDEHQSAPVEAQERYRDIADTAVGSQQLSDWYVLLRSFQGDLSAYIDGRVEHMIDGSDFLLDALFCEYAYIVNLDTLELEVYESRSKNHAGRYAETKNEYGSTVSLIASIPLATVRGWLPNVVPPFLKALGYTDEEVNEIS